MTIIDRDIDFYAGEVQRLTDQIRRCRPSQESVYFAQRVAAKLVLKSLHKYKRRLKRAIRHDFVAATT